MSLIIGGFAQIVNNPSDSVQIFKVERLGNLSVPACNVVDLSDSNPIIRKENTTVIANQPKLDKTQEVKSKPSKEEVQRELDELIKMLFGF